MSSLGSGVNAYFYSSLSRIDGVTQKSYFQGSFYRAAASQTFQEEGWKIMVQAALLSIERPRRILDLIGSAA